MTHAWVFSPRDGTFFKDGRGWSLSGARSPSLAWPYPSTILGALRSAWGRAAEAAEAAPTFTTDDWVNRTRPVTLDVVMPVRRHRGVPAWLSTHRMWPVPKDALYLAGRQDVTVLRPESPRAPSLGRDDDRAREALWRAYVDTHVKPDPSPAWWTDEEWTTWLSGAGPVAQLDAEEHRSRILPLRRDVHLALDPDRGTARDGALFEIELREPMTASHEWGLLTRALLPAAPKVDLTRQPVLLGSDRRTARAELASSDVFEPPTIFSKPSRGVRVFQVTPAHFARGWLPDDLEADGTNYLGRLPGVTEEVVLKAAMVPRPEHVSGWSMEHGSPKPTRRLVAAGSVYFFAKKNGKPFTGDERRSLWLASWGRGVEEGFGRIAAGVWEF
ncbi:type III-B CRISPR module-associated protein Cmr3 [Myxococcota bacterium]|nr:type III-B CRISPR module-associated protein Cmr3 [Myxococcota bacterium]